MYNELQRAASFRSSVGVDKARASREPREAGFRCVVGLVGEGGGGGVVDDDVCGGYCRYDK